MMDAVSAQMDPTAITQAVNYVWVLVVTFLIFFMHAGFAMLEAGQVRSKNVANQLTKNLLTWSVGVVVFFLVGAGVQSFVAAATGSGKFGSFLAILSPESTLAWVDWLFGAVFAMTAATIVSGAVAGRMKLRAYVTYTVLLAAVIYPVVVGLTWAGGWLGATVGFTDFAGGMIVHGMGGIAGLTAAWIVGPRLDRFGNDGNIAVIPGHSIPFAVLGTLILCFGWYGFNVGTAAAPLAEGATSLESFQYVGRVALTTTLGMAAGALGAGSVSLLKTGKVDTLYVANGMLAGLVGITSNTNLITWYGALAIGLIAGAQLPIVFELVEKHLRIDDVCAVFPVHGSAGIIGTLLVGIPLFTVPNADVSFVAQLTGVVVIGGWAVIATTLIFGGLRVLDQIRVSREHEHDGLDSSEHGVDTYPEFGAEETTAIDGNRIHTTDDETLRTDGGDTNDGEIKLVTAYVRPDKLAAVKRGLAEVGAPSLTVTNVSGRGSQPAKTGQWRGEEYTVDLHQKVKIECIVADVPAEDVAEAICDAARTGDPGDGKVFVLPVENAYQVRTGKVGPDAV